MARYEVRCYEHPHRYPKTQEQAAENSKARELKAPEWDPVVVTARGWDQAEKAARAEIESRGRAIRGVHIGTDKNLHAYVYTEADSKVRPQSVKASELRYPTKR